MNPQKPQALVVATPTSTTTPTTTTTTTTSTPSTATNSSNSPDFTQAHEKFANWIKSFEGKLDSSCHCSFFNFNTTTNNTSSNSTSCPNSSQQQFDILNSSSPNNKELKLLIANKWKNVINQHKALQTEIEELGLRLSGELKNCLELEGENLDKEQLANSEQLETKFNQLYLKSLEQLVVVERCRRCPIHNVTIIGKTSPNSKSPNSSNGLSKLKTPRPRPISYPNNYNDRLEWDYQHTLNLTGSHEVNGSHVDLDSVDEQVTRELTEFGENYEQFFGHADEIIYSEPTVHSRPPSVEPAEKPELARAIVTTSKLEDSHEAVNHYLLMLTTVPSLFSVSNGQKNHDSSNIWLYLIPILVALVLYVLSISQEPHQLHRSYYRSEPPV